MPHPDPTPGALEDVTSGLVDPLDVEPDRYVKCVSPNPHGIYVGHAFCGGCPMCHYCGIMEEDELCPHPGCLRAAKHLGDHITKKGPVAQGVPSVTSSPAPLA